MCTALCIFQLSGSIFWMLYITGTCIGHRFCIYDMKPRSTGPFTVPKKMPFFIDFDSCRLHALYDWYWGYWGVLVHVVLYSRGNIVEEYMGRMLGHGLYVFLGPLCKFSCTLVVHLPLSMSTRQPWGVAGRIELISDACILFGLQWLLPERAWKLMAKNGKLPIICGPKFWENVIYFFCHFGLFWVTFRQVFENKGPSPLHKSSHKKGETATPSKNATNETCDILLLCKFQV